MKTEFRTSKYEIDSTGKTLVTGQLQELIDKASKVQGIVIIEKGIYLTAPLFLKSHIEFVIEENAVLLGTTDETVIPVIPTRVAGIEMNWYPGVLNCNEQTDVIIRGKGIIDGQGEYWWNKYWGNDMQGGYRKTYDEKGLRWAADYDCMRVRNVVVSESSDITLKEFTSRRSGFWNVHIVYSKNVHIDSIKIKDCGKLSPSTDGIDIDSCKHVIIENCVTSCNDDSICIKSGRDLDGYNVNRSCHDIEIRNCKILSGFGVTIGSEVSGGVYDVRLKNITYENTDCGFRIKSSQVRKGYIKDITVSDLKMTNVKYPFHMVLDWNPEYSVCTLPDKYEGEIPKHWKKLIGRIDSAVKNTQVDNIHISNVISENTKDYKGISRAFNIEGYKDQPICNITFDKIKIKCQEYGIINYTKNLRFKDVEITTEGRLDSKNDKYDNR